ncbi:MAG TPA: S46 family peptidase [Vicinamibacterales bacterium]|nr:S46 family peptidase [Vicinamibacterales bacterium]
MTYQTIRRWQSAACLAVLVAAAPLVGHADEGFWPFNRIPRAAIKQAYGVDLTDAWVQRVQQASVRFPSGSGSFVSADGLVLTNHHVAMDLISKLSTPDRDYVKTGFLAKERSQELVAKDLELVTLQTIEDVTAQVNAAIKPGMTSAETLAARRSAIAAIEKDSEAKTGLQSEMVTLYQGAQYHLYQYKKFTDVRLVFAPEFDAAFFGGDPDNFTFPRYALDMTVFRVYDNGKPLQVKHYLPFSTTGTKEGEAVFTSGHPGTTQRLNTVAHLEFLRDMSLPFNIEVYTRMRNALDRYAKQGAEPERQAKDMFFSLENSLKSWKGQLQGLNDPATLGKKVAAEASLRASVMANASYQTRFGDAWDAVSKARRDLHPYNVERVMFEGGLGLYSDYFTHARTLVRWADESQRPNGERLPEYTDARRAAIERQVGSSTPIYAGLEQARLAESLAIMRDKLGADHALVRQVLDGKAPDARAAELVAETRLGDIAVRKQLFAGGAAAIKASTDPFIVIARNIDTRARELRTKFDNEVLAVERDAYAKIAQAGFATQGDALYPDATFTLRLSVGAVKGYDENGQRVTPYTQIRGLYVRADQHGMKPPYKLPDTWAKARSTVNVSTPYNFVTTNDIVGGNSGSPVINARGELVGLVFDGNIQSLPGYFIYDASVNRAVAVDSRGIIEALRKVYHAETLASELLASVATPTSAK